MLKIQLITSAVVSSVIVLLGMLLSPKVVTVAKAPDVLQHQEPLQADSNAEISPQLFNIENSINNLLEKHRALANRNFLLEQRIAQLEQSPQGITSQWGGEAGNMQSNEQTPEEIQYEEEQMALESNQNEFDALVIQMSSESYDADWHGEMQISFQAIEERLKMFKMDSANITHSECTSQSCLVEYTYDDKTDPYTLSGLLAAQGANEVILKHESEGGIHKTLALYKR